jgi:hypothetical protein
MPELSSVPGFKLQFIAYEYARQRKKTPLPGKRKPGPAPRFKAKGNKPERQGQSFFCVQRRKKQHTAKVVHEDRGKYRSGKNKGQFILHEPRAQGQRGKKEKRQGRGPHGKFSFF